MISLLGLKKFLSLLTVAALSQIILQNTAWGASNVINAAPSMLDSLLQASLIVQLTLLILIFLSLFCWGVAFVKFRQFAELRRGNDRFANRFWKAASLENIYEDIDDHAQSSMARVFKSAYVELRKLLNAQSNQSSSPAADQESPAKLSGIDNLERVLRKSIELEIADMESRLTLLATTGSTGPFIGLFGTVWGIMGSFHKIGLTGSASLAVVAPGISEALITTAIGLAAAIPAVVLYNQFVARIRREEMALNNFSADFLNIVKRSFFKGS